MRGNSMASKTKISPIFSAGDFSSAVTSSSRISSPEFFSSPKIFELMTLTRFFSTSFSPKKSSRFCAVLSSWYRERSVTSTAIFIRSDSGNPSFFLANAALGITNSITKQSKKNFFNMTLPSFFFIIQQATIKKNPLSIAEENFLKDFYWLIG